MANSQYERVSLVAPENFSTQNLTLFIDFICAVGFASAIQFKEGEAVSM